MHLVFRALRLAAAAFALFITLSSLPAHAATPCADMTDPLRRIACNCAVETGAQMVMKDGKTYWRTMRPDSYRACWQQRIQPLVPAYQGAKACETLGNPVQRFACMCTVKEGGVVRMAPNGGIYHQRLTTASYSMCMRRAEMGLP